MEFRVRFGIIFTTMLTYNHAFYQLKEKLQSLYDANESAAIAHVLLEFITGLNKLERLSKKDTVFTKSQQDVYDSKSKELIKGKPVQYVMNSAWFMGREFIVNESVLIPRPETEELVLWIIDDCKNKEKLRILDVGAGSGCIGISLSRLLSTVVVACIDVSKEALDVLQTNIKWVLNDTEKSKNRDNIRVIKLDFLDEATRNKELGRYDIIVSNPPYIPASEKKGMHTNVTRHEPHIALFVPDNDALLFYRAIAVFGKTHLKQGGYIYCELDASHAEECKILFENAGYINVEIRKDMHGNWRMLKAFLNHIQ